MTNKEEKLMTLLIVSIWIVIIIFTVFLQRAKGQSWDPATIMAATIATFGVGSTIYFTSKDSRQRNITEYITNSRIDWSYRLRELISNFSSEVNNANRLMQEYPFENLSDEEIKGIIVGVNSCIINMSAQINSICLLLNPDGSIDNLLLDTAKLCQQVIILKNRVIVIERTYNTYSSSDKANIEHYLSEFDNMKNLQIIFIIISNLYLKLEWEKVKSEIKSEKFELKKIDFKVKNLKKLLEKTGDIPIYNKRNPEETLKPREMKKISEKEETKELYKNIFRGLEDIKERISEEYKDYLV